MLISIVKQHLVLLYSLSWILVNYFIIDCNFSLYSKEWLYNFIYYLPLQSKYFVDYKEVEVYGGDGGDGCMSFMKIPRVEFAGPDGGDGGNGGHVIFIGKKYCKHIKFSI